MIKLASWLGIALRKNRNRFYVALFLSFSLGSAFYFHLNFNLLDFEELQYDKGALDTAFDWRLRAPSADQRFLIVEIDEASLAYFSEPYGRWPWPRHVFAEALAGISFLNPSTITFNIMFSDPDKEDSESDAIFNSIIEEVDNVIFPATRLSEANDNLSEILASQLSFAESIQQDRTVAILLTIFSGAQEKMALNNLLVDDDGIVRRYSSLHEETGFSLQTMPMKIAEFENRSGNTEEFLINWPKSVTDYDSISFKALYLALEENNESVLERLSGKHVIIGLTAPGLSYQRPTPVSPFTEDSRILASIADNIINDNGLRTYQPLVVLILSITLFATLSACHIFKVSEDLIDAAFVGVEFSSILITIGSISYSNYAIDLSFIIFVGLIYFGTCRVYDLPVKSSERAHRTFFNDALRSKYHYFSVLIFEEGSLDKLIESLGLLSDADERIFVIDDFLSSGSLFQEEIVETGVVVYFHDDTISDITGAHILSGKFNAPVTTDVQAQVLRMIVNSYQEILHASE